MLMLSDGAISRAATEISLSPLKVLQWLLQHYQSTHHVLRATARWNHFNQMQRLHSVPNGSYNSSPLKPINIHVCQPTYMYILINVGIDYLQLNDILEQIVGNRDIIHRDHAAKKTEERTDPSSSTPYCSRSREETRERVKELHNSLHRIPQQCEHLKLCIKKVVEAHGVAVDRVTQGFE